MKRIAAALAFVAVAAVTYNGGPRYAPCEHNDRGNVCAVVIPHPRAG